MGLLWHRMSTWIPVFYDHYNSTAANWHSQTLATRRTSASCCRCRRSGSEPLAWGIGCNFVLIFHSAIKKERKRGNHLHQTHTHTHHLLWDSNVSDCNSTAAVSWFLFLSFFSPAVTLSLSCTLHGENARKTLIEIGQPPPLFLHLLSFEIPVSRPPTGSIC